MNNESQPATGKVEQTVTLLSLNPGIGDALQLQDPSTPNLRYHAKLIGFMNKESIIVSQPVKGETQLQVNVGESLLVRGFSGRKSYEFKVAVLSSSASPYPHLHLAFPEKIECMTLRGALRIQPKSLSGRIKSTETATAIKEPMIVVDLSTSGARVLAKRKFGNLNDHVKVSFRLPVDGEEQAFSIPAIIRKSYVEAAAKDADIDEITTYGLEFIESAGSVRMALQGYIYTMMAEG